MSEIINSPKSFNNNHISANDPKEKEPENQKEKEPENVILDDYLDLIRCSYPHCSCGKCISKKYLHNSPTYKYEKDIHSMYKKQYTWKEKLKKSENENLNRNIKLHEKNIVKKGHLKDVLLSTMKKDYYNNNNISNLTDNKNCESLNNSIIQGQGTGQVQNQGFPQGKNSENNLSPENLNNNKNLQEKLSTKNKNNFLMSAKSNNNNNINSKYSLISPKYQKINLSEYEINQRRSFVGSNINNCNDKDLRRFIGRSNYDSNFPDWQLAKNQVKIEENKPWENIPFSGNSDYKERYVRHENNFYTDRRSPCYKISHLENKGEMMKESTFKEKFRPINYQNYKDINDKIVPQKRASSIVSGPYCKNSFLSSYEKAFMYNNFSFSSPRKDNKGNESNIIC